MKITSFLLTIFTVLNFSIARADEGMWIPSLLKLLNESDMQSKGLKLTAEDLYSINKSSLKDAIVQFGGGCTGELISPEGLMLTNHHCGYGQIQYHSSIQNNYIKNGYWAKNRGEELPNPGLTATFIVRIDDVTTEVLKDMPANITEAEREERIRQIAVVLQKKAVAGTHYDAFVRAFYNGNQFFLFVTETFKDVRLVGAPPYSIGNFGGDTDNWMWPRHTGDFSLFRIYANAENKPAEYSASNVPYKPKKHFTISLKGQKEGDFTMVYGFPGRTNEYLSSHAVEMIANYSNPVKVKIRAAKLAIMEQDMESNDTIRIQYAAKYAGVSNAYKKWIGETRGLKKLNAVSQKKDFEKRLIESYSSEAEKQQAVSKLLNDFKLIYDSVTPYSLARDYFSEALLGIEALQYSRSFTPLIEASKVPNSSTNEEYKKQRENAKAGAEGFYKNFNANTDKKIMTALLSLYNESNPNLQSPYFKSLLKKHGSTDKLAEYLFKNSIFYKPQQVKDILAGNSSLKKIEKDPLYILSTELVNHFNSIIRPTLVRLDNKLNLMNRTYMQYQLEHPLGKKMYPDANSTLRVTYGQVKPYEPRDGVKYKYYTTIDGIMQKEDTTDSDFIVPQRLKELYATKDFGRYADEDGNLRIAFIGSNHTTGGNSGSPVLNGEGQLIGTNFDRNWEGTMSDIMYDPDMVRNITVDIRYTLFVIDKFARAGYLLNEMSIVQ